MLIAPVKTKTIVCLHTMDPRGTKMGGIETHVQLVLKRHPASTSILFVGVDEKGDLPLGVVTSLLHEGRRIDFLPMIRVSSDKINKAATGMRQSVTLRFALACLRHLAGLRRATAGGNTSAEVERFEFAIIPKLMGLPFVLMVHNEGTKADKMDSLLKRYWFLHQINERLALLLADRIFAVNASIARHVEAISPRHAAKTEVMAVSVDTDCFKPSPFVDDGDAFHVCFAGRLDEFKNPPLMFEALHKLDRSLAGKPAGRYRRLVFHYLGASDPARFDEFGLIKDLIVLHGICRPARVACVMRQAHAGIITSFFEGMPCYLLEMIASGRPVVSMTLPQFTSVIVPGVSGALVERQATQEASADRLVTAFEDLAIAIDTHQLDPSRIASLANPFSVSRQMSRLFACHDAIAASDRSTSLAANPLNRHTQRK